MYYKGEEAPLPFAPETSGTYYNSLQKCGSLPTPSQIIEAEQNATKEWGERKQSSWGGSAESQDDSLFHAFGEVGPVWIDSHVNVNFVECATNFFEPMFNAKPSKNVKPKGAK